MKKRTIVRFRRGGLVAASIVGILAYASLPPAALAQDTGSVGLLAGVTQYDLSGVGTVPTASFRATTGLDGTLLGELALAYFAYTSQGERQVNHVMPEVQLQAQWPREGLQPYLGVGGGFSYAWTDVSGASTSETEATLSLAGGFRLPVIAGWILQAELRVRTIDPWTGTSGDWGLGLAGRF